MKIFKKIVAVALVCLLSMCLQVRAGVPLARMLYSNGFNHAEPGNNVDTLIFAIKKGNDEGGLFISVFAKDVKANTLQKMKEYLQKNTKQREELTKPLDLLRKAQDTKVNKFIKEELRELDKKLDGYLSQLK